MKEIPLNKGQIALVDDEDYSKLVPTKYQWQAKKHGRTFYAYRKTKRTDNTYTIEKMHNLILKPIEGFEVDHINGDGIDNRKGNLRLVTHKENCRNRHVKRASNHVGVGWHKKAKKWRAYTKANGKDTHLGLFLTEEDAIKAYEIIEGKQ